jgi:very-short-patch-repair endonuclease
MGTSIEERIGSLARRQHGVVTRAQLLELGLSPKAVRHRAKTHRLRPLHRGVYLVGPIPPARAREMAAVLAIGLYAVLSHWSAAWLWRVLAENNGPLLTRSEAEARFLSLIRKARLPAPKTNVMVEGYEVDFLWPVQRIVVEVDGYRYHGSRPQFEKDRRRATELAARGIQVISLSWRQIVNDSLATAVQLGQALVRAERR